MAFKSFILKTARHEYELYCIVTEYNVVQIHGYPIRFDENNEVNIKFDSYHLTLDEFEGDMNKAIDFLNSLYKHDSLVVCEDYDLLKTQTDIENLFK